jgi:TRAP-type C4-dicarboxylate transport system permease small subunit
VSEHLPDASGAASRGVIDRLGRIGTAVENALLVVLLTVMMLLAVGQIVLRIFFSSGLLWADELLKLLVLWIALVASVAAARSRRHLRIDVLSRYVPLKFARVPEFLVDAFAAGICGLIAWHSMQYILLSIEFEETVLVNTPSWLALGILPVSFALMCYRFTLHFLSGLRDLVESTRNPPP